MLKNRRNYYITLFAVFLACCLIVVSQPNRFQKWNSIKRLDSYQNFRTLASQKKLELEDFVENIHYKNVSDYVYTVHPEKKYKRTILEGFGDCSTMSFGAAYYLLKSNITFELIHFLPPDTLFSGGGHVALRVPYSYKGESRVGIVDLAGGGLPLVNGVFIDIDELETLKFSADFHRINAKASEFYESYYEYDYLKKVYFGFTPGNEVKRYYNFIEMIYFSFGHEKLEKLFYDGLAILFGQYYSIYVDEAFLDSFKVESFFYSFLLYLIRMLIVLGIIIVFFEMFSLIKRKKILAASEENIVK